MKTSRVAQGINRRLVRVGGEKLFGESLSQNDRKDKPNKFRKCSAERRVEVRLPAIPTKSKSVDVEVDGNVDVDADVDVNVDVDVDVVVDDNHLKPQGSQRVMGPARCARRTHRLRARRCEE